MTVRFAVPDLPFDVAVISDVPALMPVATPDAETDAISGLPEDHTDVPVILAVVPSLKVPVARKACVPPMAILDVAGVTAIDTSDAGTVTVKVALPDLPFALAVMRVLPAATPIAVPVDDTVPTEGVPEDQAAVLLMFAVVPSVKVPVATKFCVPPTKTPAVAGVTAIDASVAMAVTFNVAVPVLPLRLAVMVELPAAIPVATPLGNMEPIKGLAEVHVTVLVISALVPLLKVPVATNGWVAPTTMLGIAGVTAIDTSVFAGVTLKVAVPDLPARLAVMMVEPPLTPVAMPLG